MVNSRFFRDWTTSTILTAALLICAPRAGSSQWVDWRAYAGFFHQNSWAGNNGVTTSSWLMLQPEVTRSRLRLGVQAMLSADPLLNGDCGQPQFLPEDGPCGITTSMSHPLVMMLGAQAALQLRGFTVGLNASAVGEPAFGPHFYFIRASAQHDPAPPLTHHFFNPVHSAHGVLTARVVHGRLQAEASAFNPRAVNDLYEIDVGPLDAHAARVSLQVAPSARLQVSAARFPDAGGHHGHTGEMKMYSLTADGAFRNQLYYTTGCAAQRVMGETLKACFAEATFSSGMHLIYGRAETADRLEHDAIISLNPDGTHEHTAFNVMLEASEYALGYGVRFPQFRGLQTSMGVRAAVIPLADEFQHRYLEKRAVSLMVFLSARPAAAVHHHH